MKKNNIILGLLAFYVIFVIVSILFLIDSSYFFLLIIIGSVAILSTSATVYTTIYHTGRQDERARAIDKMKQKSIPTKPKTIKMTPSPKSSDIIESYIDAMPYLKEYVESNETFEEVQVIKDIIFSEFSPEVLEKINFLALSNMEKILFIREMIYFEPGERINLIENMLENRDTIDKEIYYTPPVKTFEIGEALRAHIISLVESGEKKKLIIIDTTDLVSSVKEKLADLYDLELDMFLLSTGGLILKEDAQIKDYNIDNNDEIVLIPSRK